MIMSTLFFSLPSSYQYYRPPMEEESIFAQLVSRATSYNMVGNMGYQNDWLQEHFIVNKGDPKIAFVQQHHLTKKYRFSQTKN